MNNLNIDDALIERFETLKALIKNATNEVDTIKDALIKSNGVSTNNYNIVIKDNFRESVAGKDVFKERFGATWLKDNNLLNLSAYSTVVVARKVG